MVAAAFRRPELLDRSTTTHPRAVRIAIRIRRRHVATLRAVQRTLILRLERHPMFPVVAAPVANTAIGLLLSASFVQIVVSEFLSHTVLLAVASR